MENMPKLVQVKEPEPLRHKPQEHKQEKEVSKKYLVNKLNYVNFQDGTVLVTLKHIKYGRTIAVHAKPEPCFGEHLDCIWTETDNIQHKLRNFQFENILVNDGKKLLIIKSDAVNLSERGVCLLLPEVCVSVNSRRTRRYTVEDIEAQIIQNGSIFSGSLIEFSTTSFQIEVAMQAPQTFHWLSHESYANLILSKRGEVIYTGECEIVKMKSEDQTLILEPAKNKIQKFRSKKHRSLRHSLLPSPDAIFYHPLTGNLITRKITDLSGLGFAVEEEEGDPILLPGMILSGVQLSFATQFSVVLPKSQIIHKTEIQDDTSRRLIKCGIAIIDIDIQEYLKIISMLQQVKNRHLYISNAVDLDALWNFFFETGFIYPKKYKSIFAFKDKYRKVYKKLYTESPRVARHFIVQENGKICGHFAMLRMFEKTWINQHHAAIKSGLNRSGLMVVGQISDYINEAYRLSSANMKYMAGFFRPDNKFPRRYFGGCAEKLNDSKKCSVDSFAYLNVENACLERNIELPSGWILRNSTVTDLDLLNELYEFASGGLALKATDLTSDMMSVDSLSKEYAEIGLYRKKHIFSLIINNSVCAVAMVTVSDIGINMSNLNNCIYIFALESEFVTSKNIQILINKVAVLSDLSDFAVMLYPENYAAESDVSVDKVYCLWVLNLEHGDEYMDYMSELLRPLRI